MNIIIGNHCEINKTIQTKNPGRFLVIIVINGIRSGTKNGHNTANSYEAIK